MKIPVLYIIVPTYNEEKVLSKTAKIFADKLSALIDLGCIDRDKSRILFVNDGSNDKTWEIIKELSQASTFFSGISLSRNFGQQSALLAGLMYAKDKSDITISCDADGQDDITVIDEMIKKYNDGAEVVYGVRNDRDTDSFFKKHTALLYYKIMKLFGSKEVYNAADFRLLSRKVLIELSKFNEYHLYLRGLIPLIGFKSDTVYYKRQKRIEGKTKYSLIKMLSLAMNGITNHTAVPIHFFAFVGGFIVALTFVLGIINIVSKVLSGNYPIDFSKNYFIIYVLLGMILLGIGIIGEYIYKIYIEVKRRPRYIISEMINCD